MRRPLKVNIDTRGSFTELWRQDWFPEWHSDLPGVKQSMLSISHPGVIRAWHQHEGGQDDLLVVIKGEVLVVYFDGPTHQFVEKRVNGDTPELVFVPGGMWHGTQTIGNSYSWTIYFVNKLYDYENPDELRLPLDYTFPEAGRFEWKL